MDITPKDFEQYVKNWFDNQGLRLTSYKSIINNIVPTDDGHYEIDIDITYEAFGVDFRVLVECKKHSNSIKREVLQVLHQKIQSIGAHKGIICATSDFQSGALEFSKKHGIACIKVLETRMTIQTRSIDRQPVSQEYCDFFKFPKLTGYLNTWTNDDVLQQCIVNKENLEYINKILNPIGNKI